MPEVAQRKRSVLSSSATRAETIQASVKELALRRSAAFGRKLRLTEGERTGTLLRQGKAGRDSYAQGRLLLPLDCHFSPERILMEWSA